VQYHSPGKGENAAWTTWTQQAYLKPAAVGTSQAGDRFGTSVGVSGDTVVVGAYVEDSNTTGVNSTPNESASGVERAPGAAYIFTGFGPVPCS
jgi:FG-GAP repeat